MKQGTLFERSTAPNVAETQEDHPVKATMLQAAGARPSESIAGYELNRIYLEDCIEAMASLPDASFDLAIADPPYNLSKGGNWKWDNSVDLPGFGGNGFNRRRAAMGVLASI